LLSNPAFVGVGKIERPCFYKPIILMVMLWVSKRLGDQDFINQQFLPVLQVLEETAVGKISALGRVTSFDLLRCK